MPELSINQLIDTLRKFKFGYLKGAGYIPLFERDKLTDRLQELAHICVDTQVVKPKTINAYYRSTIKKC